MAVIDEIHSVNGLLSRALLFLNWLLDPVSKTQVTYGEHAGRCFWCDCSKEVLARSICLFSKKKVEERQPVDMEGQVKFAVLSK